MKRIAGAVRVGGTTKYNALLMPELNAPLMHAFRVSSLSKMLKALVPMLGAKAVARAFSVAPVLPLGAPQRAPRPTPLRLFLI